MAIMYLSEENITCLMEHIIHKELNLASQDG